MNRHRPSSSPPEGRGGGKRFDQNSRSATGGTSRPDYRRSTAISNLEPVVQRELCPDEGARLPKIVSKGAVWHPFLYRKQLGEWDRSARPGDLVEIISTTDATLGYGLFNPNAEIAVRLLQAGFRRPDEAWWDERLQSAVALRRKTLQLDGMTDAYRVIHAEGDGLPGLVVDKFGDVLVAECFSLGMCQRAEAILTRLAPLCGTRHTVVRAAPHSRDHEGFDYEPTGSEGMPATTVIHEHDTRFRVDFAAGHKTGFYCDQRDNRLLLAERCGGKTVLDLCCYTGGFAIQAMRLGGATEVTGVELDEQAAELARSNAKLNKLKLNIVQADAFAYLRDMLRNGRQYDVIVLDPPKLIRNRDEMDEGRRKYFDFNRLAMQLVAPDGLMLTCSCSGLLDGAEFAKIVTASVEVGRRAQILSRSGAAPDHPVSTQCPEGEYLKTIWMRLD